MHLSGLTLRGFQSYREEESLSFGPDLTLLAGRNDVGKSATLRALRVLVEEHEGAGDDFSITFQWSLSCEELLAEVEPDEALHSWIREQGQHTLSATFQPMRGAIPGPTNLHCVHLALPALGAVAEGMPGTQPGWIQGAFQGGGTYTSTFIGLAQRYATRLSYISPRTVQQGRAAIAPEPTLASDAQNLPNVLAFLVNNQRWSIFAELEEFIRSAFPQLAGVATPMAGAPPQGEVILSYGGISAREVPLRLCGTGIERMLALAVGILTAPHPQLFLIDEPQAYLHPAAERSMLLLLEQHPEHQYIIATHSNYLLNATPLSQVRLLTIADGTTKVNEFPGRDEVLSELGVTAADLWLSDSVLWVEGPSEAQVLELVLNREFRGRERNVTVKAMPGASRFSSRSQRQAEATYRFCNDVTAAVAPLPITMRFLFDVDEKSPELINGITNASGGRARFLPVRELENLFLEETVLHKALSEHADALERKAPLLNDVRAALYENLGSLADSSLYPRGAGAETEDDQRRLIVGSEVLKRIYWLFGNVEYDKVADGRRLAELVIETDPPRLQPLFEVVEELAA